jgi:hypothetical protein
MSAENTVNTIKVYHKKKIDDTDQTVKCETNRLVEMSRNQPVGESIGITVNIRMTVNRKCKMSIVSLASLSGFGHVAFEVINPISFMFQERDLHRLFSTNKSLFVTCETAQRILSRNYNEVLFNADIFSRDKIFMPLFLVQFKVYVLCVVHFRSHTISFYSPTNQIRNELMVMFECVLNWIDHASVNSNTKSSFDRNIWHFYDYSDQLTVSESAVNSGVYVLICIDSISTNQAPPDVSVIDWTTAREYFVLSLMTGSFATKESPEVVTHALLNIPGVQEDFAVKYD